jgi:hypothetical protein
MAYRVAALLLNVPRGANLKASQTNTATASACHKLFTTAPRIARMVFIALHP